MLPTATVNTTKLNWKEGTLRNFCILFVTETNVFPNSGSRGVKINFYKPEPRAHLNKYFN